MLRMLGITTFRCMDRFTTELTYRANRQKAFFSAPHLGIGSGPHPARFPLVAFIHQFINSIAGLAYAGSFCRSFCLGIYVVWRQWQWIH